MSLKSRIGRLEIACGAAGPDTFVYRRRVICSVRLQSAEEDTKAAYAAAGLTISDGDMIIRSVCEWPGQQHPIDSNFIPQVLAVNETWLTREREHAL